MDREKTEYRPDMWQESREDGQILPIEGNREKLETMEDQTEGEAGIAATGWPERQSYLEEGELSGTGWPGRQSYLEGELSGTGWPERQAYLEEEPADTGWPERQAYLEEGEPAGTEWPEGQAWTDSEVQPADEGWQAGGEEPYGAGNLDVLEDTEEQKWLEAVESMEDTMLLEPEEAWLDTEEEPVDEAWPSEEAEAGPEDLPDRNKPFRRYFWGMLSAFLILAIALGAFFFYRGMYRVEPVFSQATYELGDPISTDLEDYLKGSDWSVGLGELDLSGVDRSRAGTYEAMVRHGSDEYSYQITIEDTVAPEILLREEPVYLAVNRRYTAEEVIAGVQDEDTWVQLFFAENGHSQDVICFQETGSFSCVVVAEDTSGNRSQAVLWVTVDNPPEIAGVQDIYMKVGSQVDFLEYVTATGRRDGSLTDQIQVDDTGVDLAKEGVYWLSYRVEDSRGIEETCDAKVVVASAADLQEMIGRRQINRNSHRIIGAANPYDSGASGQDDIEEALEYMRPAFVQLYHRSDTGYSSGSGYIMEITEDNIFICSNRHVVEKYDSWDIYFHDGTKVKGEAVGTCTGYDVGVVVLSRAEVPEEVLEGLMTVHIDQAYWSGLDDEQIDLGLERIDRGGGILHTTTGSLVKVKQEFDWNDRKEQTEVTVRLEHGDSGSAVVDGYGNLICMAFAYSEDPLRYWCVPLDGILEGYESITGRRVYVY